VSKKTIIAALLCLACHAALSQDYTFMWWADGWRGRAVEWNKTLHIQTDTYAAAIDVEGPRLPHLGLLTAAKPYAQAATDSNEVVRALPPADLGLSIEVDGIRYHCAGSASARDDEANFPIRIIESGRYVQRADILHVAFKRDNGAALAAEGRLELVATPHRLHLILEVLASEPLHNVDVRITLGQGPDRVEGHRHFDTLPLGETASAGVTWPEQPAPTPGLTVAVADKDAGPPLAVAYDAQRDWHYVDLPERQWDIAAEPDRLDRFPVRITNTSSSPQQCLLLFAFDKDAFQGITGMCPMLRDKAGSPTGIPVQISKNWHRHADRHFLYEGPWFHAFAEVPVEPGQKWEGEFAITYARWGGVPAASHAQLCLIGWGVNQLWDQAAIGSWGESITYDPDINLNRSMIDDVRPLMVTGMNGGQWEWTCNVGGGDFLVYINPAGKRQFLTRMRTAYLSQGPNLTDVVYAGITADGAIAARIEVSTPRCDDVNRAYHRMRYDVRKDAPFSRLAFYQVGADRYNDHAFTTMARGNADGLIEEWNVERGGCTYHKSGLACEGRAPWYSLHGGERNVHHTKGAWANRGMVVRAWKARLGGQDCPVPFAAVYGTEDGIPSANMELMPPPGMTELKAGDFVEAEVELLIVPMAAADYYGPNASLRADLEANGNTWRPIHRLAKGNDIDVEVRAGSLLRRYPPIVQVDDSSRAAFTIKGGVGYLPVTLTGLRAPSGYVLLHNGQPVNQEVHGNDFWQCDDEQAAGAWRHTCNVPLEAAGSEATLHEFVFRRK